MEESSIFNKINKLSLPAVILIASVILGGFYYVSQVSKQRSIEGQQKLKIEQEKQEVDLKATLLDACLEAAKEKASKLTNTLMENAVGTQYESLVRELNRIEGKLENEKNDCFKKYPQ